MFARIKNFLRHLFGGGESLIAFGSHGEELIHEEEWSELPEEKRDKWESLDKLTALYRRKR